MNKVERTKLARKISSALTKYETREAKLHGITNPISKEVFIEQIIDSTRRVEYIKAIQKPTISSDTKNPLKSYFDPLKGAILFKNQNNIDEAVWLTFLQTHFGKHRKEGWRLIQNVYGSFGNGPIWTFERFKTHPNEFYSMLDCNKENLETAGRVF